MQYRFQSQERIYNVEISRQGEELKAVIDGQSYPVEILDSQEGQLSLNFNGQPSVIFWAEAQGSLWINRGGCTFRLDRPSARPTQVQAQPGASENVRSPMPAQVRAVLVTEGETVEKGQTLLLLEAMKMEIRVKSPLNGRVGRLLAASGQAVGKDQVLAEIGRPEP